jgi:hypothetical protein
LKLFWSIAFDLFDTRSDDPKIFKIFLPALLELCTYYPQMFEIENLLEQITLLWEEFRDSDFAIYVLVPAIIQLFPLTFIYLITLLFIRSSIILLKSNAMNGTIHSSLNI